MELRTTEKEVNETRCVYNLLRERHSDWNFPPLAIVESSVTSTALDGASGRDMATVPDDPKSVLNVLKGLRNKLSIMGPNILKFQARSHLMDPITGEPRYGPATQTRVLKLLQMYDDVNKCLIAVFGEDADRCGLPAIEQVRLLAQQQEQHEQLRLQQEQQQRELEHFAKQEERERHLREASRKQRERQEAEERQRQERARQYEEGRLVEQRAREATEQADRDWLASITKGPDGVREQFCILLEATKDDPVAQKVAVKSLHTIFKQITSKPEEVNFRRIRRDHERFNEDVGRHAGGKEILVAAGFELGAIDDVSSFISKEPDIERDMNGWSGWFELLKETLRIIEEQLMDS
ncbi:hypothetical protein MPSEU_000368100 [Mayamaea pseudoterrestris]|nr:hypothetical protein MPSEU_000368100 [Mayamaea pseudoterrestris]